MARSGYKIRGIVAVRVGLAVSADGKLQRPERSSSEGAWLSCCWISDFQFSEDGPGDSAPKENTFEKFLIFFEGPGSTSVY